MSKTNVAQKLTNLRNDIRTAEEKLKLQQEKANKLVEPEKKILQHLLDDEIKFKEELLMEMKKESIDSISTDSEKIILTRRQDIKVTDSEKLTTYILENAAKTKQYLKDKIKIADELIDYLLPRTLSTIKAKELLKNAEAIDGIMLPGGEKVVTEYLTIKQL